ncbi:MAG: polyprenyl synthetase family protein [Chloroflexi bacterium]|nr:polyprenyl synthetase family protein [Chloroflexota bacterium]
MTDISARPGEFTAALDREVARLLSAGASYAELYDMLRYHLGWLDDAAVPNPGSTGKRLRPVLCLLAAESVGGDWCSALPAAVAVELVHKFTLVHDDIQDASPLRWHRETVWMKWGTAQAINVGDALLIVAEQALTETPPTLSPGTTLGALRILNRACRAVCEGQYLDLRWEHRPAVSVEDYLRMIDRKTARLFACAAELGALCAGASIEAQEACRRYGSALGMAFQAVDDVLGAWGLETETGKSSDLDVSRRKKTLPVVLGLAAPPSPHADRLRDLFAMDRELTVDETAEATRILEDLGAREQAASMARQFREEAFSHLVHPSLPAGAQLRAFTSLVLPDI